MTTSRVGRAKDGDLKKYIQFDSAVRHVGYDKNSGQFAVTVERLPDHSHPVAEMFDDVVVATGHFSVPNVPHFPGIETFPGRVLHGHDFRERGRIQGQGSACRRRQLLGRGHRPAMPQIRREIRHHVLANSAHGLQMARDDGGTPAADQD